MNRFFSANEIHETKPVEQSGFKEIKPEKQVSQDDIDKIWNSKFLDDHGEVYRDQNVLLPNHEYELNGYKYKTDRKGRVIHAEGQLHIDSKSQEPIESIDRAEHGYKDNDDRGHLIGRQFGGSGDLGNIIPMDAGLNRGDYEKIENKLAAEVKAGNEVHIRVEPKYGLHNRPKEFRVIYTVNGEKDVIVFRNRSDNRQ